jgi:Protein of unknown function (DUF402)
MTAPIMPHTASPGRTLAGLNKRANFPGLVRVVEFPVGRGSPRNDAVGSQVGASGPTDAQPSAAGSSVKELRIGPARRTSPSVAGTHSLGRRLRARPWLGHDAVRMHRFSEQWSTWRWLTAEGTWRAGSYINLERTWLLSGDTFDTDDVTLDLVIDANGDVTLKDDDELDWLEQIGIYSNGEAPQIRAVGRDAIPHFISGGWPPKVDWSAWLPPHQKRPPALPDRWQEMPVLRP